MPRTTRWFVVPLCAALLVTPAIGANAQSVNIGIMAGGSLSTFTGNFQQDVSDYAGFIGGAFVRVGLMGFAVQPGIYYTTKGVKSTDFYPGTDGQQKLDYIQIPLVARLSLGPLYVGGGPAIGIRIGCSIGTTGTTTAATDCKNVVTTEPATTEVSGIAEAGLRLGKFSLGVRADLGLSDIFSGQSINNVNVRTRTISAIAEIVF